MPRAGPSKVAKKPSPAVSISRPRNRSSSRRTRCVVLVEQLAPAPVAELGRALGRADDVGEEHGREHAIRLGPGPDAREELLDLVDDRVGIARPDEVLVAGELDELRARDLLRRSSVPPRRSTSRSPARWRTSVGTRIVGRTLADVDLRVHPQERDGGARAGAAPQVGRPARRLKRLVARSAPGRSMSISAAPGALDRSIRPRAPPASGAHG